MKRNLVLSALLPLTVSTVALAQQEPRSPSSEEEAPGKASSQEGGEVDEEAVPPAAVEETPADSEAQSAVDESSSEDAEAGAEPSEPKENVSPQDEPTEAEPTSSGDSGNKAPKSQKKLREGSIPELRGSSRPNQRTGLGLDPGAPQAVGLIGGITPSFGQPASHEDDWLFDIHGYLQLPLRIGFNQREEPQDGQKKTVLHTPPLTPGNYGDFDYTGVNPDPWAQLNFTYGSSNITGTVIIAARTVSNANGYFHPPDQLGINDAFVSYHPSGEDDEFRFSVDVGAFANRYGIMGQYDLGPYGTALIARVAGMGATGTTFFKVGDLNATVEGGFTGQLNKAPLAVEPAGWNGYADPNAGTSYVGHGHAAFEWGGLMQLGLHGIYAFSQDDRATTTTQKDGNIGVYGGDLRFTMKRFGHLYMGYAHTVSRTARSVSRVIRVLGAPGGLGLMNEYFGSESEGTGNLNTFGLQYDFSLGNYLRSPKSFSGHGPDLVGSLFGVGTVVSSPVPEFDDVMKLKYGLGATYTFLSFMGVGARYDLAMPDVSDGDTSFATISGRLIFKSDWGSQDQVSLQYSRYLYGSDVVPADDPAAPPTLEGEADVIQPDANVVSLMATMWW